MARVSDLQVVILGEVLGCCAGPEEAEAKYCVLGHTF